MAIGLSANLDRLLNTSSSITPDSVNPNNLERLGFRDRWEVDDIDTLLSYDQEGADRRVDELNSLAEGNVQGVRVLEATEHLIDTEQTLINKMKAVQKKLAKLEITTDEAYTQWKTLKHELNVAKQKNGFNHAADVEEINVSYANHQRGYQAKLNRLTDTGRKGTETGSSVARNRFPVAIGA